jgi:hypothetical protein
MTLSIISLKTALSMNDFDPSKVILSVVRIKVLKVWMKKRKEILKTGRYVSSLKDLYRMLFNNILRQIKFKDNWGLKLRRLS